MAIKRIEYMCSHCGKKETRFVSMGKPQPGKCPRRQGDVRSAHGGSNRRTTPLSRDEALR